MSATRRVVLTILLASVAAAAAGQVLRFEAVHQQPGYWTPEALRAARPHPLPLVPDPLGRRGEEGRTAATYGTGGLDFTSSRLLPADAHLAFPYSAVGRLFFSLEGDDYVCSGAIVSSRLVLTAGHCVLDDGIVASNVAFAPGYHMGDTPFGLWTSSTFFVTEDWADVGAIPHPEDWALLIVDDRQGQKIGDVAGWLGFKLTATLDNHLTLLGYPGNLDDGERMHRVDSSDWFDMGDDTVVYGSDMGGGSSGGPWVQNFGVRAKGQRGGKNSEMLRIVGVTSYGFQNPKIRAQGSSVFSRKFKTLFAEACNDGAANCRKKGKPGGPVTGG